MTEPVDDEQRDGGDAPETLGDHGRPEAPSTRPSGRRAPTGRTTKWSVDRLDPRERRYSFVSSAVALVFGIAIYVTETNDKHFHLAKGQFTPFTTMVVGLAAAVLLLVATLIGRRALVGFVALFTFLAFSNSAFVLGLPFLALAAWLLYRSYKVQKAAAADLRAGRAAKGDAKAAAPSAGSSKGSTATTAKAAPASRSATRGRSKTKGPAGPEPNKRFTPKQPTRPAPPPPKPSWRERRAARTTD